LDQKPSIYGSKRLQKQEKKSKMELPLANGSRQGFGRNE
jgi:hypothetical protein